MNDDFSTFPFHFLSINFSIKYVYTNSPCSPSYPFTSPRPLFPSPSRYSSLLTPHSSSHLSSMACLEKVQSCDFRISAVSTFFNFRSPTTTKPPPSVLLLGISKFVVEKIPNIKIKKKKKTIDEPFSLSTV